MLDEEVHARHVFRDATNNVLFIESQVLISHQHKIGHHLNSCTVHYALQLSMPEVPL